MNRKILDSKEINHPIMTNSYKNKLFYPMEDENEMNGGHLTRTVFCLGKIAPQEGFNCLESNWD